VQEGVVRALCRASYAERALRILSWMDVRGYSPRAPTYRELVQVCALEGQVVWAWTLHQRMRRLGHRPDRATCSCLVGLYKLN
jgi:pentatricopeptide repeat protein